MKKSSIIAVVLAVSFSCSYKMYDKTKYEELDFEDPPNMTLTDEVSEVYLMSTFRSSKVLSQVIDGDTVYDDISIPVYTTEPSKDLIQSAYLIFNTQTEKVCFKVSAGRKAASGHRMFFQQENSGCDLFGKYRLLNDSTLGLNMMNDESLAFHISCGYRSEYGRVSDIKFEVIDYKNGLSETQGSTAPPIRFDQVFYTQMKFNRTDSAYVYVNNKGGEVERSSVELPSGDPITVQTKKGKTRKVQVKGYPFFLK